MSNILPNSSHARKKNPPPPPPKVYYSTSGRSLITVPDDVKLEKLSTLIDDVSPLQAVGALSEAVHEVVAIETTLVQMSPVIKIAHDTSISDPERKDVKNIISMTRSNVFIRQEREQENVCNKTHGVIKTQTYYLHDSHSLVVAYKLDFVGLYCILSAKNKALGFVVMFVHADLTVVL